MTRSGAPLKNLAQKEGAKLVPVRLEMAKLAAAIGYVVIAGEARAGLRTEWRDHQDRMSDDLVVTLAVLDAFSVVEYLDVCRRVRLRPR